MPGCGCVRAAIRQIGKRLAGIRVFGQAAHIAVHPPGVRPVGFYCHGREAFFKNQTLGDQHPLFVKLVRTMRGFADQRKARLPQVLQQQVIVMRVACQRVQMTPQTLE